MYALQNNVTQTLKDGEPWGIDRVDGVLDQKYMYAWTGKGVSVYIFDTGIQSNHDEFKGGRVTCGINLVVTEDCEDLDGHGTHVAGTVGGKTYGVAKGVNLVTVKVLNMEGVGNTALVIKGLEYVMQQKLAFPATPMIVNLSLGTGKSSTFNEAVNRAVDAGLVVIVASGNESVDACTTSPASAEKGITVGATDKLDGRPNWSNYGPCVDLHAYVLFAFVVRFPGGLLVMGFFCISLLIVSNMASSNQQTGRGNSLGKFRCKGQIEVCS